MLVRSQFSLRFSVRDEFPRRVCAFACRASIPNLIMPKRNGQGIFLRASRDIEKVKRHGRRFSTNLFNLLACKIDDTSSRVGIIVGKRFGNAVRRNRVKRIFRELVRQIHQDFVPGQALLVFPKREALLQPFEELERQWGAVLERAHLLRPRLD